MSKNAVLRKEAIALYLGLLNAAPKMPETIEYVTRPELDVDIRAHIAPLPPKPWGKKARRNKFNRRP